MRLLIMSDLHMEFGEQFDVPHDVDFDVAIFAGDVWKPVTKSVEWLAQQRDKRLKGRPVILVNGNHEFYNEEITSAREAGWGLAASLGIHLLDPGVVVINGVRFIGATLWTDFQLLGRPISARRAALRQMNDYRRIKIEVDGERRTLRPHGTQELHNQDRAFIEAELAKEFSGPTVVVTHHSPHPLSVAEAFRGSELSPAYASDLTEVIESYRPTLWVHGHDHHHHHYRVGDTMIFANPAGYPDALHGRRENEKFDPRYVVEI